MKKLFSSTLIALAFILTACEKEPMEVNTTEDAPLINWQDSAAVSKAIGSHYNIHHSNLYGISEAVLTQHSSDELFGLAKTNIDPAAMQEFITTAPTADLPAGPSGPALVAKETDATASTYYNSYSDLRINPSHSMVYNWDVFIYVENDGSMSAPADNDKVVFYALQTDFGNGQGAHTGLQWANGVKKLNWGGYWNGVVQPAATFCGTHSCNYAWSVNTPYRFRVWRLGVNTGTNRTQWGAWVMNMWTNQETFIGSFYSTANNAWITGQSTWIETIRTGTSPLSNRNIQAIFSYLTYRTASATGPISGAFQAYHARANYNDWETPPPSTTQDKNVSYPFDNIWWGVQTKSIRHKYNTTRTVPALTDLW